MVRRAQSAAMRLEGDQWARLSSVAKALVDYQMSDEGPLLRTSALSALPSAMRGHRWWTSPTDCRTGSPP